MSKISSANSYRRLNSTPPSSSSNVSVMGSTSTLSNTDQKELNVSEGLLEWLAELGLDKVDKDVLRVILRSPFKDFLQNFCVPSVRSDTWISTMRSNIEMLDDRSTQSAKLEEDRQKYAKIETELKNCQEELDNLQEDHENLLEKLKATYAFVDDSSVCSLMKSKQIKISNESEKKYLLLLKKNGHLRRQFLDWLNRNGESNSQQDSSSTSEELKIRRITPNPNPISFEDFNSLVCKRIQKYLCTESSNSDSDKVIDHINAFKSFVQSELNTSNSPCNNSWYKTSRGSGDADANLLAELPSNKFSSISSGLKEFNQIIFEKLLEWSQFHLDLHSKNESNNLLGNGLCDSIMENSTNSINNTSQLSNENPFLNLLIKEERLKQTLRFYQNINPSEYADRMLGNDSTRSRVCKNNVTLSSGIEDTLSSFVDSTKSKKFDYELSAEVLLNAFQQLRLQLNEGLLWSDVTFETQVDELLKSTLKLIKEDVKIINNE